MQAEQGDDQRPQGHRQSHERGGLTTKVRPWKTHLKKCFTATYRT